MVQQGGHDRKPVKQRPVKMARKCKTQFESVMSLLLKGLHKTEVRGIIKLGKCRRALS